MLSLTASLTCFLDVKSILISISIHVAKTTIECPNLCEYRNVVMASGTLDEPRTAVEECVRPGGLNDYSRTGDDTRLLCSSQAQESMFVILGNGILRRYGEQNALKDITLGDTESGVSHDPSGVSLLQRGKQYHSWVAVESHVQKEMHLEDEDPIFIELMSLDLLQS